MTYFKYLFFLITWVSVGQNLKDIEPYLDALNNYQFERADSLVLSFNNHKEVYATYVSILREDGQKFDYETYSNAIENNSDLQIQVINKLVLARAQTSFFKDSDITASVLKEALEIATFLNYKPLIKRVLLDILYFSRQDVKQFNNEFENYLERYKQLATKPIDNFYYHYYNFIFQGKGTNKEQAYYFIYFESLKNAADELAYNHKVLPFYNFEKALYQEILGNYEIASQLYQDILIATPNKNYYRHLKFGATLKYSFVVFKIGNPDRALSILEELKCYYNKNSLIIDEYYYYAYAADYQKSLGNYDKAYDALKQSMRLNDSLDQIKAINQRTKYLIEYESEEKEQARIRNRNIALALGFSLLLGGVIAVLFYKNAQKKRFIAEQQRALEIQKTEKLLKEQELTTINAMIEGQEKERQKLAGDLHDSVGATLAAAKLQFNHLASHKNTSKNLDELYTKTGFLLDEAYKEIRAMAHLKNSGVIAKQGLLPALQKLATNASVANNLTISVEDFGLDKRLDNTLEITIFRIIQELVTNIIKHANATEASIVITQHDDEINIIIEDNGKGFDVKKVDTKDGMGLGSIERRVKHLDGIIEIDSTPGIGTNILIEIPL